jgi:TRAP-type uncharacterized transport system substrate-binding protein/tRNA A-37 threonylcarbamoyl transferase component Bud32
MPSRDDFLGQYPDLADRLTDLLNIADSLGDFVGVSLGGSGSQSGAAPAQGQPVVHNAETLHWNGNRSETDGDSWLTLPAAERKAGRSGPTLPYDLGDYRLLEVLGRGGMGVVYLAEQKGLGRRVAVKMIRSGILASEAEVRRFAMEAKAAAALEHRNIVSVYQSGYLDGHYYFSMEYVPGVDLAKMIEQAPLGPSVAARYVRDVARAIHHAHRRGVLHRDLKPANVLITPDDEVRVTDFGLAKQIDTDSSVTGSGAAVGTPSYMAPEQASGHSDRVRVQSDVYALGAILFAAITGRAPFGGEGVMQTLMQVIHQPAPSLRSIAPHAPEDLETIVAKCLEKAPEDRYRSAAELAEELDAYLDERPITARPRPIWVRVKHWLQQVPLIAAVLGRRVVEPSAEQRRFQAAMLGMLVLIPIVMAGAVSAKHYFEQRIPGTVRIAGGLQGGVYHDFSIELGQRLATDLEVEADVVASSGSIDNRDRLLRGEVLLAPMQAAAMGNDELSIVAPLFFEAIHILVHEDSAIRDVSGIEGHEIAVGPAGSGSRLATEMVLESLGFTPQTTPRRVINWPELASAQLATPKPGPKVTLTGDTPTLGPADLPDVAIVCIGKGSRMVRSMLAGGPDGSGGGWRLIDLPSAIDISLQHPSLRPMSISASDYPSANLPPGGISTLGATAFLVTRWQTPDRLVTASLSAIYRSPGSIPGLISRDRATEWQGLGFHPAARRYFASP